MSSTLRSRFTLEEVRPGGLLLDLVAGTLFELNESAVFIWRRLLSGQSHTDVQHALASHFGLADEHARLDVDSALAFSEVHPPPPPPTDFHYARSGDTFVLSLHQVPTLQVDSAGEHVIVCPGAKPSAERLRTCLHAIAPKVLALHGAVVLHASAVSVAGTIIALSGLSGSGKTTTARSLVRAGAMPVCEDQLVLEVAPRGTGAVAHGERLIHDWEAEALPLLASDGRASCLGLGAVKNWPTLPLVEIGFIDASRRKGRQIDARPLEPLQSSGAIFRNAFYGSDSPEEWRRLLGASVEIPRHVRAVELDMPEGLASLDSASAGVVDRQRLRS